MFNKLYINILFANALMQIYSYTKFFEGHIGKQKEFERTYDSELDQKLFCLGVKQNPT